jgi:predicted SprT family Zn-dependent metalloprotease
VDFLINLVKERYHLIKPRDPNEKKGSWKESTEDLVAVVLKQSIIIEKDRIFLLKTKFKCPICKSDLSIRQPRNKVIIKCSKCDADIRYSRDALLIFKDERRYNILVSFPPRQRGWH